MRPSRRRVLGSAVVGATATALSAIHVLRPGAALAGTDPTTADVSTPTKTVPAIYTTERVAAARRNIADYAWARSLRDAAVAAADPFLGLDDEALWHLVTGQRVPRSHHVNRPLGSPTGGTDIYRFGHYPWLYDVIARPWKIVDPITGHVFPTNDFEAFHRSGLDEHGVFDPERADRSLLVNELYPEFGPTWGVDDGYGWIDDNGDKWLFAAYYNHWALWLADLTNDGALHKVIRDASTAYVYTGDLRYAHIGLILLDRVADVYPALDIRAYPQSEGYLNSHGGTGKGRAVGSIWEANYLVPDMIRAYDAMFDAVADGDAAGIVPFLSAKAEQYGLPPKDTVEAIRVNIENGLLRQVYPAVQDAQIRGNFGMHQNALTLAAVVLDSAEESQTWIDWVFATGELLQEPDWHLTGGDVLSTLVDDVDRDGFGYEVATGYNFAWVTSLAGIADALEARAGAVATDLYQHPKYAAMIRAQTSLTMLNRYLPSVGDGGLTGNPGLYGTPEQHTRYFEIYGDPLFAQYAALRADGQVDRLYGSVFSTDVAGTQRRIAEILDEKGPLRLPAENLTGYGLAALRAGEGEHMRDAWIYYGRTWSTTEARFSHAHRDALNLGMHAHQVDVLPDIGYPEAVGENPLRREWTGNTVSHNTVVVDAGPQQHQWVGEPHGFAATDRVQYADIAAPRVYPGCSVYRRAVAQIAIDDSTSYTVDVFRVVGGTDHLYSMHAGDGTVAVDGLNLVPQPTGTYAGPDVEMPDPNRPVDPSSPGFDWLFNVERDNSPRPGFAVDWALRDPWDVGADPDLHVRCTMVSHVDDVALADGLVPLNRPIDPPHLRYLLARRRGRSGRRLASCFVAVIEPHVGTPAIGSIRPVAVESVGGRRIEPHEVAAVRIELADGRVDYVVQSLRTETLLRIDHRLPFVGAFGVVSFRGDRVEYAFAHDAGGFGSVPRMDTGARSALEGRVLDFTRSVSAENALTVELDERLRHPEDLVGSYAYVQGDGTRNAVYRIRGVRRPSGGDPSTEGRSKRFVLDIGGNTTVRGHVDPEDTDLGYRYDMAPRAKLRIPLTREYLS